MSWIILVVAVTLIGALLLWGTSVAASREYPGDKARADKLVYAALAVFTLAVVVPSAFAYSGVLGRFDLRPPPMMIFFFVGVVGGSFAIAFSPLGALLAAKLSFAALVGFQAFRILAELTIFAAVKEGIAPVQMSFEGYNFDILTALTAIALGLYLRKHERSRWVLPWNIMGIVFLVIIAFIALTSFPLPIRIFMNEPSNEWVSTFPYVLLPGVLVVAALTGHLLVFRKLRQSVIAPPPKSP